MHSLNFEHRTWIIDSSINPILILQSTLNPDEHSGKSLSTRVSLPLEPYFKGGNLAHALRLIYATYASHERTLLAWSAQQVESA